MTRAFVTETFLYGQIGDQVRILPATGAAPYSQHHHYAGRRGHIIEKQGTNGPLLVRLLDEATDAETDITILVLDGEIDNETRRAREETMTREQRLMVAAVVFAPATVVVHHNVEVDKFLWDAFIDMAQQPPFSDPSEVLNDFLRDYTEAYRGAETQGSEQG